MSEADQPAGNTVENNPDPTTDIPPSKFKVGDWVKMTAAARSQLRFHYMQKDDVGIVTNVSYVTKRRRRWWQYQSGEEKYYLVTVYWQNSVHRKTGHEVKLREKRLKFASRKRKSD